MVMPLKKLSEREQRRFSGYVLSRNGFCRGQFAAILDISPGTVSVWEKRFAEGLNVLDAPRSGRNRIYGKDIEDRFIAFYCQTAPLKKCGEGRWSLRIAENELKKETNRGGII